jgi:hypothetical protein
MNPNAGSVFPIFFVVWALLCAGSAAFFFLNRNAALKRKVLPPFLVFTGALFLGFVFYIGALNEFFYVAVPMVALITWLNVRASRFCDACGRTLHNQNPLSLPRFCSKCGAPLRQ